MPTTYAWQVLNLDVYCQVGELQDVVYAVDWRRVADDGNNHAGVVAGRTGLGNLDVDNFTPFPNLTQAQVEGWVEEQIGVAGLAELNATLDQQIAEQIAPTVEHLAPPWI